ncbi:Enhancer of polycomb-like protein 1 [Smittium mucronatum]|uniref:Enhancer of polycomb-like protein n=1 Tax=Smittium mucronatum TaxID=133383 RepID=A0A1R0GTV3_9FUNG|nr:Enhancer of polycomb-like protein 1 [Smittium mucronatum]
MKSASAQRFRARKIDLKKPLSVYLASELSDLDHDDLNRTLDIETGVEKEEESEHHLQAAISAAHAAISCGLSSSSQKSIPSRNNDKIDQDSSSSVPIPSVYIPTPETKKDPSLKEKWYSNVISFPKSRIRSILTVEDACCPMYCMDEEDEKWLSSYNSDIEKEIAIIKASLEATLDTPSKKKIKLEKSSAPSSKKQQKTKSKLKKEFEDSELSSHPEYSTLYNARSKILPENKFELLMDQLEAVSIDMVFNSLNDFPPLGTLITQADTKGLVINDDAKFVFEYWKNKRSTKSFKPIMPTLKTEDPTKTSSDPYICFRKREVKQIRKTRRADIKASHQLQKLQINLVCATQLLESIVSREELKRKILLTTKKSIEQRSLVLALRRHYGIPINGTNDLFSQRSLLSLGGRKRQLSSIENDSQLSPTHANSSPTKNTNGSLSNSKKGSSLKNSSSKLSELSEIDLIRLQSDNLSSSSKNPLKSHGIKSLGSNDNLSLSADKKALSHVEVPVYSISKKVSEIKERIRSNSERNIDFMSTSIDGSSIPFNIADIRKSSGKFKPISNNKAFTKNFIDDLGKNPSKDKFKNLPFVRIRRGRLGRLFLDQSPASKCKPANTFRNYYPPRPYFDDDVEQFIYRQSLLRNSGVFNSYILGRSQNLHQLPEIFHKNASNDDYKSNDNTIPFPNLKNNIPEFTLSKNKSMLGPKNNCNFHFGSNSSEYLQILNDHAFFLEKKSLDGAIIPESAPSTPCSPRTKIKDIDTDDFNANVKAAFSSNSDINSPSNNPLPSNQNVLTIFDSISSKGYENPVSSNRQNIPPLNSSGFTPLGISPANSIVHNPNLSSASKIPAIQLKSISKNVLDSNSSANKAAHQGSSQNDQIIPQAHLTPQQIYQQQLRMQMHLQACMQIELRKQLQQQMQIKNPSPEAKLQIQRIQASAQRLALQQQFIHNQNKSNIINNINSTYIPNFPNISSIPQHPLPLSVPNNAIAFKSENLDGSSKESLLRKLNDGSSKKLSNKPDPLPPVLKSNSDLTNQKTDNLIKENLKNKLDEHIALTSSSLAPSENNPISLNSNNSTNVSPQKFSSSHVDGNVHKDSGSETDTDSDIVTSTPDQKFRSNQELSSSVKITQATALSSIADPMSSELQTVPVNGSKDANVLLPINLTDSGARDVNDKGYLLENPIRKTKKIVQYSNKFNKKTKETNGLKTV